FTRNTIVATDAGQSAIQFQLQQSPTADVKDPRCRVEATGNVFAVQSAVLFSQMDVYIAKAGRLGQRDEEALLRRLLSWRDRGNVYSPGGVAVSWGATRPTLGRGADWKAYWSDAEADIAEGTVKFKGGNLTARAEAEADNITAADFRLRHDSAGYQA